LSQSGLGNAIKSVPPVFDETRAQLQFDDLRGSAERLGIDRALDELLALPLVRKLLDAIMGSSPYLTQLILRDPARIIMFLENDPETSLSDLNATLMKNSGNAQTRDELMRALREYKSSIALLTALCDLADVWPVMKVTAVLSDCADLTLQYSVRFLLQEAASKGEYLPADDFDLVEASGYIVVAMGKHGAWELNYSSDIDLIVFYIAGKARLRDGVIEQTFFVRLTRALVKLMQESTADGYVFRTDLRLRPDPGATQVALSTEAAHGYYESFGQNWERAAMIKARAVAGDIAAGNMFLNELQPFVWRKYLDFATIADVHAMKRQIHTHKGFSKVAVGGHNIKLGRGGIREIEFFAQTQQLIAGGRQEDLRISETLKALDKLVERGWIEERARDELQAAYIFLRMVEHRLQMINDEQTQTLPGEGEGLLLMARFCGFGQVEDFEDEMLRHLNNVQGHYGALFEDVPALSGEFGNLVFTGDEDDPRTLKTLHEMGFENAPAAISIVRGWHFGRYRAMKSETVRSLLTEFQPALLGALGHTSDPDFALRSFDSFLSSIPAGVQLFSLLRSNPELLRLVADIMGTAPRLASIMSRQPRLLEAVLDPGFFGEIPSQSDLDALVEEELTRTSDYQDGLERVRIIGKEQSFLTGVRVLSGTVDAEEAGANYAAQARALIRGCHGLVEREVAQNHGEMLGSGFVVIAMGKLGGSEMSASSDVDLITVYDFDEAHAYSDGKRALHGNAYYARCTQRLISALTSPMAEGRLYEVDMRLRPSGNAGPVATRLASFDAYQRETAWTWEHMALTRAKVISGPPELRSRVEEVIRDVLMMAREPEKIVSDVREMRDRIALEKGSDDPWNIKQVRGGLIDLEFIAQYLQLVHGRSAPGVLQSNTFEAFQALKEAGVIDAAQAETLISATRLMHNLMQVLRLCIDGSFEASGAPEEMKTLLCRASNMPDFSRLHGSLKAIQVEVFELYEELVK